MDTPTAEELEHFRRTLEALIDAHTFYPLRGDDLLITANPPRPAANGDFVARID